MKKGLFVPILLGLILLLAACGSDESGEAAETMENDSAATEVAKDTGASNDEAANNEVNVIATNFDLGEDEYIVNAGEEVTLTLVNEEGNHGISIDALDVDLQGEGEVTFTPEEPGEYTIYCNIFCGEGHEDMTATLVVV
ncbi:cupredoxin domain-containing protein [Virgibacillus ainsalahensis]